MITEVFSKQWDTVLQQIGLCIIHSYTQSEGYMTLVIKPRDCWLNYTNQSHMHYATHPSNKGTHTWFCIGFWEMEDTYSPGKLVLNVSVVHQASHSSCVSSPIQKKPKHGNLVHVKIQPNKEPAAISVYGSQTKNAAARYSSRALFVP